MKAIKRAFRSSGASTGANNAYDIKCLDKDGAESDLQTQLNNLFLQVHTLGDMLALATDNGKKSFHTSKANNNYALSITFNKEFVSPPEVKCSAVTNYDDGTYSAALTATVSNVTNVGCTITVNVWCAYPTTTTVTWSATGYEKTS